MIDGRGKYGALPYQEDLSKIHPGTIDSKQDTEQLNSEHETVFQNSKIEVTNILHFFYQHLNFKTGVYFYHH